VKMVGRRAIPNVIGLAEQTFQEEMEAHLTPDQVRVYRERGSVAGSYLHNDLEHPERSSWRFWSDLLRPGDEATDYWETVFMMPGPKGESPMIVARTLSAIDKSRNLIRIRWVAGK
jgi:hypothetical protein